MNHNNKYGGDSKNGNEREKVYQTVGINITSFTDDEYTNIETDLHTYTNDYR